MIRMNPATAKANKAIRASVEAVEPEDSVCQILAVTSQAIVATPNKPENVNAILTNFLKALPCGMPRLAAIIGHLARMHQRACHKKA